jgi:uncharacterized MAPEG superfamily protein
MGICGSTNTGILTLRLSVEKGRRKNAQCFFESFDFFAVAGFFCALAGGWGAAAVRRAGLAAWPFLCAG